MEPQLPPLEQPLEGFRGGFVVMVALKEASAAKFVSAPPGAVSGFLLYGSDTLQISARAEALANALLKKTGADGEIVRLHETDAAAMPERLAVELTTGSLFGGARILWLTSCPVKAQNAILEAVQRPLQDAFLIVQAPDLKKSHKLAQTFETASHLAAIPCYGEDRESLVAAIQQHVSSQGYEFDVEAASLIAMRCDFSALIARTEAEKVMTYAGSARRIEASDVDACLIDQQTAGLSDIVDHALDGEGRKALLALDRFLAVEQNVTGVFVALSSALLRLHALRAAADAGTSVAQAIKELRPPVFFKRQDALAAQVRLWPGETLARAISDLNAVLRDTRLRPALAEDLTARFIIRIAKAARSGRSAAERSR
jgi:DNA polymerase III subunit delta